MYTQVDNGITAPETFGLLPAPDGRQSSFVQSLAVNVGLAALFACLTLTQVHQVSIPNHVNTELVFPSHIPPPTPHIRIPTPRPPKLEISRPMLPLQEPETVRLNTPPMPLIAAPPARVVAPAQQPKTGGFGDPAGVAPNPNASRPATIAAIGSFENAPGASRGSDVTGGRGTIATGSFGGIGAALNFVAEMKPTQEQFTPPRVLAEPRPQYTEEAKQLKIQGEVTLQVRFGNDGKVEVLRVVTGLGHGLDEEATRVAERIQFKPAEKNGKPADNITYIHILFQLA
jgi:TonB family protein